MLTELRQSSANSVTWPAATGRYHDDILSVVIPAFNEEDGIEEIARRVQAVTANLRDIGVSSLDLIVVDDGSSDRTAEIAASLPFLTLIRHPVNRGYGAAIKTGFCHARGGYLAFLDADGTYPPEAFPLLYATARTLKADVVVGSRRSGAASEMPRVRRLGNFIWSTLLSRLAGKRVEDPASGMRIIRRAALPRLYPLPDGLNFTPVMSTRAVHEGLRVVEMPIAYRERIGRSKLSVVRDGTRFLTTILATALEYKPARVLGTVGLSALALAGLIALALVALRVQGVTTLGPMGVFSLFSALVLGVAGISILSLGITFNYLVALFHKEPNTHPPLSERLFGPPLDRHFGWIGMVATAAGLNAALGSLLLGMNGWDITRLWFWALGSALLILVGVQLILSWVLMRVLESLSEREGRILAEMELEPPRSASAPAS